MDIQKRLFELRDEDYARFQRRIIPTVKPELIIGVRVPALRKLAGALRNSDEYGAFTDKLPHDFYEEDMLHAILISSEKDYGESLRKTDSFLPYVNNWAVCDTILPKEFKLRRDLLISHVRRWTASDQPYTCRFGLRMLMLHYLEEDFDPAYLRMPLSITSEHYYVRMAVAWFYAEALTKQWDAALPYLTENHLSTWIHNKAIQKARESYRIPDERKNYLKDLKRDRQINLSKD